MNSLKTALFSLIFLFFPIANHSFPSQQELTSSFAPEVISSYEERDLELFNSCDHVRPGIFISRLDSTYTLFGQQQLIKHLKSPITDIKTLKKRQQQLANLVENSELLRELTLLLAEIKEHQEGILYVLGAQDPLTDHTVENFYFKNSLLAPYNGSSIALDAHNYIKYLGLFGPVVEHVVLHLALAHVQQTLGSSSGHDHSGHDHHDHICVDSIHASHDASFLTKSAFFLLKAGHFGLHALSIKEMINQIYSERALVNTIHKKIVHAHCCLVGIKKVYALLKKHGYDPEVFGNEHQFFDDIDKAGATSHKELLAFIEDTTFVAQAEISFFSRVGPTLSYYRMLKNETPLLQKVATLLGDIDALGSVARWYTKTNAEQKCVCFVEYITGVHEPSLSMRQLWHIALDHKNVTKNNLCLGDGAASNMIITGPNKAGKSSILKAVGLNIILAQSFGIAAAEQVHMTIFDKIISYITIFDDITRDTSMMVAEMMRVDNCMQILRALKPGQFACVLVDDSLFKGTTIKKGQELAEQFIAAVGQTPQSCSIVATHLPVLTKLEDSQHGLFKNYCIDITMDSQGKSHSTFSLREGVADQHRVFDIIDSDGYKVT